MKVSERLLIWFKVSAFQWEPTPFLPKLFINVFYIDIKYECKLNNAFPNLKCVPELFS